MDSNGMLNIRKAYQCISALLWLTLCFISFFVLSYQAMSIVEVIIVLSIAFFCLFLLRCNCNNTFKQLLFFSIFLFFYWEFVNLNVTIKYMYEDSVISTIRLLYVFYSCCMLYILFLQWLSIILIRPTCPKSIYVICVSMLSFLLIIELLLFMPNIGVNIISDILLYYLPVFNYIMMLIIKIVQRVYLYL